MEMTHKIIASTISDDGEEQIMVDVEEEFTPGSHVDTVNLASYLKACLENGATRIEFIEVNRFYARKDAQAGDSSMQP